MQAMKEQPTKGLVAMNSSPHSDYDAVVIGLAPKQFSYENLNLAFRILKGELNSQGSKAKKPTQIPLIATHKAKYMQTESGLSLGPGPFVAALEFATGLQAHIVGKPTKEFLEVVICDMEDESSAEDNNHSHNSDDRRIAIIGDDVEADLGGGTMELNLWRVLGRVLQLCLLYSLLIHVGSQCAQENTDPVMKPGLGLLLRMRFSIRSQHSWTRCCESPDSALDTNSFKVALFADLQL